MANNDGLSQHISDKLDKNNFHAWKFRMTNFLMGKGYWDYIVGEHEDAPEVPEDHPTAAEEKAFKDWNQGARKVMYWLSVSIHDSMIGHIQDAISPKQAWDRLVSFDVTNTKARKLQLKTELNTVKKEHMSINDYTLKIKSICESLASIAVTVDDDDKVEACLRGLTPAYKQFKTSIQTRENIPSFSDLIPMLVIEEKNIGEDSSSQNRNSSEQTFYSNRGRGRGRSAGQGQGRGRGRGHYNQGQQQQQQHMNDAQGSNTRGRGQFRGRGRGRNTFQRNNANNDNRECWGCGGTGHFERDCPSRNQGGRRQQNNYATTSRNTDDSERLFVMQHMMNTMSANASKSGQNVWYVDSGASNHMTSHGEWFKELQTLQNPGYVETGDDTAHPIAHTGNVPLSLQDGNTKYLADVLHVPNITKNLVSVGQMVEQGLQVRFNADGLYVEEYKKDGKLVAQGKKVGRMFTLDVNVPEMNAAMFAQGSGVVADVEIWHKQIGHVNVQRLKTMQSRELVTGLPMFKVADMQNVCEACQFGKQAKGAFPHDKHVSSNVLEVVHSDVWGPAKTVSMGGCRFYVTFIDDHTRKVWVYFMKEKSEVFTHFQNFKAMAEKQTGKHVQCLRSDGGGEYFSNEFSSFLKKHGIQRQFSCRYTPQQNGVAERKNRHIAEVARALMSEKHMPHCYWAEAVSTAVYIMNRTPTAAVHDMTPEEKFSGRKPDLAHLKVFGCIAYVHVPDELRTKLDPKAEKCVFIGYSLEQKGYKCYNPVTRQVRVSRDVVFDEMVSWYADAKHDIGADVKENVVTENAGPSSQVLSGPQGSPSTSAVEKPWSGRLRERESPASSSNVSRKGKEKVDDAPKLPNLSAGYDDVEGQSSGSEHSLDEEFGIPSLKTPGVKKALEGMHTKLRRSSRAKKPVQRLVYDSYVARHCAYMAKIVQDEEPTHFDDAIGDAKWEKAMDEEMDALDVNETWDLVPLPKDKNVIGCKWVYKVKHNSDGSVSRYKARLVAKGYAQTYGIDYEETFSPVAKMATVRAVIAVAASKGWLLHQMDVKNAFLHGDLQEEVYMEQPQGYEDVSKPHYVCKLKKALYGLKQAPRAWHARIVACLVSIGFHMADADHSLYVRENENGIVIICIYVDDLIVGGDNEAEIAHVKTLLKQEFDMKDLGELRYFLGIEIVRTKEGIWLSQRQYALDMLSKYGMADCKPISMPLDQNLKLRADEGQVLDDVTMYRKIVGSLIYLTISRPDLSYTVGLESQFMQLPRKPHLDAVRRTLRYVSATLDYALFYEADMELELYGYTDADWAGSVCDRRSTSGFMFSLGSAAITWSSKKQPTVALSSTEAEYRGAAVAACEVAWLQMLLADLGIQVQVPVVIYCDNLSSIQLARNPVFHARTKHIEVHYHFVRERVLDGDIDLTFVRTDEQVADIFTKALGAEKLRRFRAMLGVQEMELSLRGSVEISRSTYDPPD